MCRLQAGLVIVPDWLRTQQRVPTEQAHRLPQQPALHCWPHQEDCLPCMQVGPSAAQLLLETDPAARGPRQQYEQHYAEVRERGTCWRFSSQ